MKKLKIAELNVTSFVTLSPNSLTGGISFATCGPATCASACSETDGVHICKQETNNC